MAGGAHYAATEKRPPTVSGRCRCSQPNRAPPAMHPPCAHKPYLIRKPCTCTPQALSDLQAYDHADERQHAVRPLAGAEAGAPPRARLHTHNTSLGTSFGSHPVHTAPRTHTPSRHLLSPLTQTPRTCRQRSVPRVSGRSPSSASPPPSAPPLPSPAWRASWRRLTTPSQSRRSGCRCSWPPAHARASATRGVAGLLAT